MMKFYNTIEEQHKTTGEICDLFAKTSLEYFDKDGKWLIEMPCIRERLWTTHSLLHSSNPEDKKRAVAIMETYDKDSWGPFEVLTAVEILLEHDEYVIDKARDFFDRLIKNSLVELLSFDMNFCGVNDNFPCMGMAALSGLYKLTKDERCIKQFEVLLTTLEDIFRRNGTLTEYASPTYTAFQMRSLAKSAEFLEGINEELMMRTLAAEERLWFDSFSRFYEPSTTLSGAFSRTGTTDSIVHTNTARGMFYAILKDKSSCSIIDSSFIRPDDVPKEPSPNYPFYIQIVLAEMLNTVYHCPSYIVEMALNRTYPYVYKATADFSSSNDIGHEILDMDIGKESKSSVEKVYNYNCNTTLTQVYMTKKYSLGTSTREFHNGVQTDSFHLTYTKDGTENMLTRVKSVYCRYVTNDNKPQETHGLLKDEGRKICLQSKNSALVLYSPKAVNAGKIKKACLSLCLYSAWNELDEVYVGDKKITSDHYKSSEKKPVFIKDGDIFMCVTPLINSVFARSGSIEVKREQGFVVVNLINYDAEEMNITQKEMILMGNGFGFEVREACEFSDFEDFRTKFKKAEISDTYLTNEHVRYTFSREVSYQNCGDKLSIEYTPVSEGIRYNTVNDKMERVNQIYNSDFDVTDLPLME